MTLTEDMVLPLVYEKYKAQRITEINAFIASGAVRTGEELNIKAQSPNNKIIVPFVKPITGRPRVTTNTSEIEVKGLNTGQDTAAIAQFEIAVGSGDLAISKSGNDNMKSIADQMADYWSTTLNDYAIASLNGIFKSASMASNLHETSEDFNAKDVVLAAQKLGDMSSKLKVIAVNSLTKSKMKIGNIENNNYRDVSNSLTGFDTYLGYTVVEDDKVPENTAYLLGEGSINYGDGTSVVPFSVEVDRQGRQGLSTLITRRQFIMHVNGVSFTGTPAGEFVSFEELEDGANWGKVYETKNVAVVKLAFNVAEETGE